MSIRWRRRILLIVFLRINMGHIIVRQEFYSTSLSELAHIRRPAGHFREESLISVIGFLVPLKYAGIVFVIKFLMSASSIHNFFTSLSFSLTSTTKTSVSPN